MFFKFKHSFIHSFIQFTVQGNKEDTGESCFVFNNGQYLQYEVRYSWFTSVFEFYLIILCSMMGKRFPISKLRSRCSIFPNATFRNNMYCIPNMWSVSIKVLSRKLSKHYTSSTERLQSIIVNSTTIIFLKHIFCVHESL